VTISGNMGVSLIGGMTQATLTSLNAAGLTASGDFGGLTFTSGALAASSVITGSAAGTNTINLNAATTASTFVTYTGGTGSDVIASTNALNNVFTLGNGGNSINAGGAGASDGNNTVTAGTGNDTIRLGNGNNIIDVGAGTNLVQLGIGNNTITGGTGADTVDVGTGSNTIVVGGGTSVNSVTVGAAAGLNTITTTSTGVDTFVLSGIQVAGGFYSSLNGWAAGDVIDFALVTTSASTVSPLGAKITLGAAASFANYLDAAAISTTANTVAAVIKWFNYGSNTYIAVDNSDLGSFTDGFDSVVELVGTYNLSTSTVAADVLTFV
jgi:S-layer protein